MKNKAADALSRSPMNGSGYTILEDDILAMAVT